VKRWGFIGGGLALLVAVGIIAYTHTAAAATSSSTGPGGIDTSIPVGPVNPGTLSALDQALGSTGGASGDF
jgi:hypothetical protein